MKKIIEVSEKYLMNTYNRFPIVIDRGDGAYLYDNSGKKYLDFLAGVAVNSLGYGNEKVLKVIEEQSKKIIHCSNCYYNEPMAKLAKLLMDNSCFSKLFFSNCGTEAVETALKIIKKYKKGKIIAMKKSFHGRSCGALSLTGQEKKQNDFLPLLPDIVFAEFNNINSVKKLVDKNTSAIIVEPVQGEGGVYPAKKEFLLELRKICDENDVLLVFDEIQCGVGRLGNLFAYQFYGVEPDIVCLAKALGSGFPIGVTLAKKKVSNVLSLGSHGSTFGGNPLATSVAFTVINEILSNKILENVKEVGKYFIDKLKNLKKSSIKDVRGIGLMVGIELNVPLVPIISKCMENRLLLGSAGENTLRILPPLIINKNHVDEAVNILQKVL
jgi:acetylornithine/N-succinyldiaminopimelate aminotransferase